MSETPAPSNESLAPARHVAYADVFPARPRPAPAEPKINLYPLQTRLVVTGAIVAAVALVTQDWSIALALFSLFAMVGASWRIDMVPIIPACIAFQWISTVAAYIYYHNAGYVPGRFYSDALQEAMILSIAGLAAVTLGFRIALYLFRKTIHARTFAPATDYDIRRLFTLTLAAFAISYVVDIAPKAIWFGGAQIIENLLALRFVPYFMLLVAVMDRRRNYRPLILATAFVTLPQLLTGFSDFKEILFVILIAMLARWRPWIRTKRQSRENWRMLVFGTLGAVIVLYMGMAWNGGIKAEWRDRIWSGVISESPIERMVLFFEVSGRVVNQLNMTAAAELLVARLTSGEIFLAQVTERVPTTVPHENGRLLWMAVQNTIIPRFLFPEKASLGGDSWLVRKYAGEHVAGDESAASIGLGYMAEFYIDFGVAGMIGLSLMWGLIGGAGMGILARASPSREIFLALIIGVLTQLFMSFDGSFIKLFAGFLQRTAISYVIFAFVGQSMHRWLTNQRRVRPAGS